MTESPVALLRVHAKQAPWNARGLAAYATSLVDAAGMRPTNAAARAALSARAVRFYVSNGLLDRPDGKGTAAIYGYRHLLLLLAIKIRQREGQTLDAIRAELKQQSGDALERRIAQVLSTALSTLPQPMVNDDDAPPVAWRRVPIAQGIELHVRDDSPASAEHVLHAMRTAVRAAMNRDDAL